MTPVEGEVIGSREADDTFPTLEQVNRNAFKRLNELILEADAVDIPPLLESLSKLNASIRNNNYAVSVESDEAKAQRDRATLVGDLLKKNG